MELTRNVHIFAKYCYICYHKNMKKWKVSYYNQVVIDGIKKWPKGLQAKYVRTLDLMGEFGPNIPPVTKSMGRGLFEIRVKAREGIGRAFFCYQVGNEIIVLHSFIKITQSKPKKELDIAMRRLSEVVL